MPLPLYCRIVNARNLVRGRRIRLEPFEGEYIYKVRDATDHLFLCRRSRYRRYKRGIQPLLEKLAQAYHLDKVPHGPEGEGFLIDCGANIGELGVWARAKGLHYLAFEPEPLDARCTDLNVFDGRRMTIRKALWNRTTTIEFFSKPESADSSIIDPGGTNTHFAVEAVRLDDAIELADLADCTGPVILKVEGEGAEPEILEGASGLLPSVDFVTIDCGPERGRNQRHTFVEANALLVQAGFRLVQFEMRRMTALYRNPAR